MFTEEQKKLLDKLSKVDDIDGVLRALLKKTQAALSEIKEIEVAINKVIDERTIAFPWLADAIAQYHEMRDLKIAEFLRHKLRPAIASADRVREIAKEKRILQRQFRLTRNYIKYYEALFPWLPEFVSEDIDDLVRQVSKKSKKEEQEDPVQFYLTKGEYEKFSTTERNQQALDRYWSRKKSSWQIGRDYERYVGYVYESNGYRVYYQGIEEGFEDLGRDLIAKKKGETKVIQCKCWAQHKTIHEKHICQLFGTTLKYWIEQEKNVKTGGPQFLVSLLKDDTIQGVFVTATKLSEVAREFARELGIQVNEQYPLQKYPSIKCNISKRTAEKIYHLPMDQQYDRTIIELEANQCYVETVAEAEALGFRRAWRWSGKK